MTNRQKLCGCAASAHMNAECTKLCTAQTQGRHLKSTWHDLLVAQVAADVRAFSYCSTLVDKGAVNSGSTHVNVVNPHSDNVWWRPRISKLRREQNESDESKYRYGHMPTT